VASPIEVMRALAARQPTGGGQPPGNGNCRGSRTTNKAWRRLNNEQRLWVEQKNPELAAEAAMAAIHFGTVAWH
jgi:hypothetical protein